MGRSREPCIGPGGNDYGQANRLADLPWNAGLNPLLHTPTPGAPSPARDVPRVDPLTADVEKLADFMEDHFRMTGGYFNPHETAREMVKNFDELEEILGEILNKGGVY